MNWVLIAVLGILFVFGFLGLKKGFVKILFSFVSTVIALLFAILVSPIMARTMKNTPSIKDPLASKVEAFVDVIIKDKGETAGNSQEGEALGEKEASTIIDELPLPKTIKESITEELNIEKGTTMRAEIKSALTDKFTGLILNAAAFVAMLFFAIIVLFVLCRVLNLLAKLPLIREADAAAGLGVGVCEGILVVWILFVCLTLLGSNAFGQEALAMIGENKFLDFLYKNNPISAFLSR